MTAARRCLVVALVFVTPAFASGLIQTAPPGAPPAPNRAAPDGRPDYSGNWTLEPGISVDPAQIRLDPSAGNGRPQGRNRRAGFGGFGGGGRGGSRPRDQKGTDSLTESEQERLTALTAELKNSSSSLVISHHDPSFVVADSRGHAQFFQTDGSSTDNHVGDTTVVCSTRWDGARIVTEYPLGSRLTLVFTYTLVAASNQLVLRVDRKEGLGLRPFSPDVKLVYTRSKR